MMHPLPIQVKPRLLDLSPGLVGLYFAMALSQDHPVGVCKRKGYTSLVADYYDARGKRVRKSLGTTDWREARRKFLELIRTRDLELMGEEDRLAWAAKVSLDSHVADWRESLRAGGLGAQMIRLRMRDVCMWQEHARAARLSHFTLSAVEAWLAASLRRGCTSGKPECPGHTRHTVGPEWDDDAIARMGCFPQHLTEGVSLRVRNERLVSLRAFARWLVADGRLSHNPVDSLRRVNQEVDRRYERACLTLDELELFLPTVPRLRWVVYVTAGVTGLRRAEMRRLEFAHLDWTTGELQLAAKATKSKRRASAVLPPYVVEALRSVHEDLEGALREARVSPLGRRAIKPGRLFPVMPCVVTLQKDLQRAGLEWDRPEGVIDLHSLRVSFGTALEDTGVGLSTAQKLLRHSDPKLTSNVYTRAGRAKRLSAVAPIWRRLAPVPDTDRERRERLIVARRRLAVLSQDRSLGPEELAEELASVAVDLTANLPTPIDPQRALQQLEPEVDT